ncbi:hypothetical protein BDF21DRAFT_187824 [Thamnidium elegans]|nr:hypothetical protein BDF21DRAFT_206360 [Thamnidium elegans]KAI8049414.1 hypothetical protein BDF21DRAFT_187824 [Thamnidium elegans]
MDHLPAEVYYCIFHYLNRPDIRTCSFVCKRLNVFALQRVTMSVNTLKMDGLFENLYSRADVMIGQSYRKYPLCIIHFLFTRGQFTAYQDNYRVTASILRYLSKLSFYLFQILWHSNKSLFGVHKRYPRLYFSRCGYY